MSLFLLPSDTDEIRRRKINENLKTGRGHDLTAYGADRTGTDDTSAALVAAFTAAGSGGTVYAPPGTYLVNSGSAVAADIDGIDDIRLIGDGAVFFFPDGTSSSRPIVFRNIDGLEISGCTFRGGITFGPSHFNVMALSLMNVANARIHDCLFEDITQFGIIVSQDTIGGTSTACPGIEIYDNTFRRIAGYAIQMFPKVVGGSQIVRDNLFEECGNAPTGTDPGHAIKCGQGYEETTVAGNTFVNCAGHSGSGDAAVIAIPNYCHATIAGNDFISCPALNIGATINSHSVFGILGTFASLAISGNRFHGSPADAGSDSYVSISTDAAGVAEYDSNAGTVTIEGNAASRTGPSRAFVTIRPTDPLARVTIANNRGLGLGNFFLLSDNAGGAGLADPIIEGNALAMAAGSSVAALRLYQSSDGTLAGNTVTGTAAEALELGDHTGEIILARNTLARCNTGATAGLGAVELRASAAPATVHAYGNTCGAEFVALISTSAAYTIHHAANVAAAIETGGAATTVPETVV